MPLSRHRCVEVATPYKPRVNEFVRVLWADDIRLYRALFHYSLLLITLSEAKQPLSLGLRRAGFPAGEPNRFRSKSHLHMLNNIMRHQYIQKIPDRHYTVGAESIYIHSALLQAAYLYQFLFYHNYRVWAHCQSELAVVRGYRLKRLHVVLLIKHINSI